MKINWKKTGYLAGIGFGIIFITAFIFSQIVFPVILGSASQVETPDLIGLGLSQGKRILTQERLHAVVTDSVFAENSKIDQILEQSPKPGVRIKEDGTVYLVISKGSKMMEMPNVIGLSYEEAMLTLRNSDLKSGIVDSLYSDTEPRNTVMRSVPMTGSRVERKTRVKLYLSMGSERMADSLDFDIDDF